MGTILSTSESHSIHNQTVKKIKTEEKVVCLKDRIIEELSFIYVDHIFVCDFYSCLDKLLELKNPEEKDIDSFIDQIKDQLISTLGVDDRGRYRMFVDFDRATKEKLKYLKGDFF